MLQINERTLFDVERPGWLDSDAIRLKTAGVVVRSDYVPSSGGRRILKAGYPLGKDPNDTGKYVPARRASLTLEGGEVGNPWRFRVIAARTGVGGYQTTIQLRDPGGNNQPLTVTVTGTAITVSLATGSTGDITSTCEDVVEALLASEAAMELLAAVQLLAGADVVVNATAGPENLLGGVDAEFLTLTDVEVTNGDSSVAVIDQGRVIIGGLPLGLDGLPVVDAGVRAQLPGITFVE